MKPRSSIWSTSSSTRNSTAPEMGRAVIQMIEQTARRRHQHVEALRERADLRAMRHAAEDHRDLERQARGEIAEALRDLAREFAGRAEHERARSELRRGARVREQLVEDRQRERRRLAGAGLGDADEIAARHQGRDRLRLDRRRLFVAHFGERVDEGLGEAEAIKVFQFTCLSNGRKRSRLRQRRPRVFQGKRPACPGVNMKRERAHGRRTKALHAAGAHRPRGIAVAALSMMRRNKSSKMRAR